MSGSSTGRISTTGGRRLARVYQGDTSWRCERAPNRDEQAGAGAGVGIGASRFDGVA